MKFGSEIKGLWHLDPDATLLNHGSFGACPREVLAAQQAVRTEMEHQPDVFFRTRARPLSPQNAIRAAAEKLGRFVGTTSERIAFVVNATEGVNTVLHATHLERGDEILVLDCVYNAVRISVENTCSRAGAHMKTVSLPIPLTANNIVERIADAAGPRTRLAIIDHIASPTAIVFPVSEITRALTAKGVRVLIDGAHAVGHLPLDLPAIGADWYTSNCHKWLYAPKGCAFLYAAPDAIENLKPLSVSHWHDLGFPLAFDYVGTRDVSAFLSVPAALAFIERMGIDNIRAYMTNLARDAGEIMRELGAEPVAPESMSAALRAYILPQRRPADAEDAAHLMATLWEKHRIQVASNAFQGKLLIRLSTQIYNDRADIERLAGVLRKAGWPGR